MAEKIKYTRKDLKGPDEIMSAFGNAVAWTRENRKVFLGAAAVLLLAVVGTLGAQAYFRWEESKATRDLWPHLNRAQEFLQSPAAADPEKLAALEGFLTAHVNTHPGTKAAVYARYHLGNISFARGNYALSEGHYRAAIQTSKAGEIMPYLLQNGLATALEAKGDFAGAADAYGAAASAASGELKVQALLGRARALELGGRKQEAAVLYRQLLTDSAEQRTKEFIEIKLAQAN